jgi:hypothetical protein
MMVQMYIVCIHIYTHICPMYNDGSNVHCLYTYTYTYMINVQWWFKCTLSIYIHIYICTADICQTCDLAGRCSKTLSQQIHVRSCMYIFGKCDCSYLLKFDLKVDQLWGIKNDFIFDIGIRFYCYVKKLQCSALYYGKLLKNKLSMSKYHKCYIYTYLPTYVYETQISNCTWVEFYNIVLGHGYETNLRRNQWHKLVFDKIGLTG